MRSIGLDCDEVRRRVLLQDGELFAPQRDERVAREDAPVSIRPGCSPSRRSGAAYRTEPGATGFCMVGTIRLPVASSVLAGAIHPVERMDAVSRASLRRLLD